MNNHSILSRASTLNTVPNAVILRALGASVKPSLPELLKPAEVASRLGTTSKRVQYETDIALGKLVYGIRKSVKEKVYDQH